MMHQQILLLFLALIIIGLAAWVGFEIYTYTAVSDNRDAVTNHLLSLGGRAQAYYRAPATHGGGENSFAGLTLHKLTQNQENRVGEYFLRHFKRGEVVEIVGIGKENGIDGSPVRVTVLVFADDSISVKRVN